MKKAFELGNNIMWTAENTHHTYLHILQNTSCIIKAAGHLKGEGEGEGGLHTPCTLPLDQPLIWMWAAGWG